MVGKPTTMRIRARWLRAAAIVALTLPLLETTCVDLTARTVINGFSGAVDPLLAEFWSASFLAAFADWPAEVGDP
ncbi:MAG: hypothetical protein KKB50_03865 [Planctomycetes bacterium]|nr:hypothetical protein [Planctomycetota bacterium]